MPWSVVHKFIVCISLVLIYSCNVNEAPVKKSRTGICHESGSLYYDQTKHYTAFTTVEDCIQSGGRLPKRK